MAGCTSCGQSSCDCRVIDVTGNPDICKEMEDLIQEYVCQLACDIHDFKVCNFEQMINVLAEVLEAECCVFNNLERWLCVLENRDIAVQDTKTVDMTKIGDWQLGDSIVTIKSDVKVSKSKGNSIVIKDDGLFATMAGADGYQPVIVKLSHKVPRSHFDYYGSIGGFRQYFSGSTGNEDYFDVPKKDMDIVDTFILQTKVTGNFVCMKTADIQTAVDMGTFFRINIDVYLSVFPNTNLGDVWVDAIVVGRKKLF